MDTPASEAEPFSNLYQERASRRSPATRLATDLQRILGSAATDLQRTYRRTRTNSYDLAPHKARIYWPNRPCSCGLVLLELIGAPRFELGY